MFMNYADDIQLFVMTQDFIQVEELRFLLEPL